MNCPYKFTNITCINPMMNPSTPPKISTKMIAAAMRRCYHYVTLPENSYFFTLTFSFVLNPFASNVTFALPFFLPVIVNTASPFSSVSSLSEEIVMNFLPLLIIVASTVTPSDGQSSSPETITVTTSLCFFLSIRVS